MKTVYTLQTKFAGGITMVLCEPLMFLLAKCLDATQPVKCQLMLMSVCNLSSNAFLINIARCFSVSNLSEFRISINLCEYMYFSTQCI